MYTKLTKIDRAGLFRERMKVAMATQALNRSQLAREIGLDRSSISQLLASDSTRLPNAQVIAECATALAVSSDWLLGLTELPEPPGDVLAATLTLTNADRTSADDQILNWHHEASGYKTRHVPATLPDMLKTPDVLRWEYSNHLNRTPDQAIGAGADLLEWLKSGGSDYEIAFPLHELVTFARGEGYYQTVDIQTRRDQLDHLLALHEMLYPSLRVFLFDARHVFSAPTTIYGPLLAVIYLGRNYISFRETNRVKTITQHFDWLIREAMTDARDFLKIVQELRQTLA